MKSSIRASNWMLIPGVSLIIAGFVLIGLFPVYASFFSPNKLMGWLYAICTGLMFELGFFAIFKIKARQMIIVLVTSLCWSLVFLVPTPQGYEEPLYGGSLILLVATYVLVSRHRKNKSSNASG